MLTVQGILRNHQDSLKPELKRPEIVSNSGLLIDLARGECTIVSRDSRTRLASFLLIKTYFFQISMSAHD